MMMHAKQTFYFFLVLLSFSCCVLVFPTVISAHILQTDGTIGAVLHINPDDDPIANQQAGFFFEFKDTANKFTPDNCDCTFVVLENGKQIYSQPLFQNNEKPSLTNASVFFTFPEKNVYQVQIIGKPNRPNVFQTFTLTYDIRVDRDNKTNQPNQNSWLSEHTGHLLVGIGMLIFVIIGGIKTHLDKRKKKQ